MSASVKTRFYGSCSIFALLANTLTTDLQVTLPKSMYY